MSGAHLADEARYLHAALFGQRLDDASVARYAAAHAALFPEAAQTELMRRVMARSLDAEAVEAALRRKYGSNILTRKLQVICYLAEVQPAYGRAFVNLRASKVRAWFGVIGAAMNGAWKLAKGAYLVKRHGLR
jgi:hypothetical protein